LKLTVLIVGVFVIAGVTLFAQHLRTAEQGTYNKITPKLDALMHSRDPKAFVGFCTKDTDALYFVFEHGTFNLDYELYNPEKVKFADPFRKVATSQGYKVQETTYGSAPVLRINLGSNSIQAAERGFQFAHQLFGLEKTTRIEFLP
jgi:hypothetical protein